MRRVRIGITTGFEDGRQTLDVRYGQAVSTAGGIPLIVPLLQDAETARAFAALLDGMIITGGPGITRGLIGQLPPDLPPVDRARDRSDALIYRAMSDRPLLGICYGMQFVNAMAGGAIYGDVQAQAGADVHSAERGATDHEIAIKSGSALHSIMGCDRILTNSFHIQAIVNLGAGLRASARTADGVIEALESDDGHVLGVQFHPERMGAIGLPIIANLVERAASRAPSIPPPSREDAGATL